MSVVYDSVTMFLRERPALKRVLAEAEQKYRRRGKIGGRVKLLDADEAHAVEALRVRVRYPELSFALVDLDAVLRASRYGITLVETLESLAGGPIITAPERRAAARDAWAVALSGIRAGAPAEVLAWTEEDEAFLRREWTRDSASPVEVRRALDAFAYAMALDAPEPLPIVAARTCGDAGPHGLDLNRPARRYLDRLLQWRFPEIEVSTPLNAEDREALLAAGGILVDDLSSTVMAANLDAAGEPLACWSASPLPLTLSLYVLNRCNGVRSRSRAVYVVENPAVFRALLNEAAAIQSPAERPTLVCTTGHLSLAARRLLDALVAGGAHLRYSGDFDAGGLAIAERLLARYGAHASPWRMDVENYAIARTGPSAAVDGGRLRNARVAFPDLCGAIEEGGAAYQESIVGLLAADLAG